MYELACDVYAYYPLPNHKVCWNPLVYCCIFVEFSRNHCHSTYLNLSFQSTMPVLCFGHPASSQAVDSHIDCDCPAVTWIYSRNCCDAVDYAHRWVLAVVVRAGRQQDSVLDRRSSWISVDCNCLSRNSADDWISPGKCWETAVSPARRDSSLSRVCLSLNCSPVHCLYCCQQPPRLSNLGSYNPTWPLRTPGVLNQFFSGLKNSKPTECSG